MNLGSDIFCMDQPQRRCGSAKKVPQRTCGYGEKVEEGKIHSLAGVEVQTELRRTSTMLGSGRVGEDK